LCHSACSGLAVAAVCTTFSVYHMECLLPWLCTIMLRVPRQPACMRVSVCCSPGKGGPCSIISLLHALQGRLGGAPKRLLLVCEKVCRECSSCALYSTTLRQGLLIVCTVQNHPETGKCSSCALYSTTLRQGSALQRLGPQDRVFRVQRKAA